MNKSRLLDILLAISFLGLLGTYIETHYIKSHQLVKKNNSLVIKANDILRYKTFIADSVLNTSVTSSACTLFLKNSAELSMIDYANEFFDHQVDSIIKTCSGAFPAVLQQRIDKALLQCKNSKRDNFSKECYASLIDAKTSSVAIIIKTDVNPKDLSAALLLHLIAHQFTTGEYLEHPERSLDIVDNLLDKEPNYLGGYRFKLLLLSSSSLNLQEYYADTFQDTLEEARILAPNDYEIEELAIGEKAGIFKVSNTKNSDELINYLNIQTKKHPSLWIYDYYKAHAIYDEGNGNYQQALSIIKNALIKMPDEKRLMQTLLNMTGEDDYKKKHPFILSIGFSLDDF
ncbi:MAG: hypothetical protein Q7U04_08600 [Bacteriovorax sp.]|nr:hypothetical protein [Bacteriovorax sp.]